MNFLWKYILNKAARYVRNQIKSEYFAMILASRGLHRYIQTDPWQTVVHVDTAIMMSVDKHAM